MEKQTFIQPICRTATTNNSSSNLLSFPLVSQNEHLQSTTQTKKTTIARNFADEQNRSNLVITQPIIEKLSSEGTKFQTEDPELLGDREFAIGNQSKLNNNRFHTLRTISPIQLNTCEKIDNPSILPMNNLTDHILSTLNPAQLTNGGMTAYYVPRTDFKTTTSSNTDLPSPGSSSNSSNPASSTVQSPTRRQGETTKDSTRKREMRLQKNREAARECRRKKKEYIRCLETRVSALESQNKALIEELRQLKELYCQREETNTKSSNSNTTGVNKR